MADLDVEIVDERKGEKDHDAIQKKTFTKWFVFEFVVILATSALLETKPCSLGHI